MGGWCWWGGVWCGCGCGVRRLNPFKSFPWMKTPRNIPAGCAQHNLFGFILIPIVSIATQLDTNHYSGVMSHKTITLLYQILCSWCNETSWLPRMLQLAFDIIALSYSETCYNWPYMVIYFIWLWHCYWFAENSFSGNLIKLCLSQRRAIVRASEKTLLLLNMAAQKTNMQI